MAVRKLWHGWWRRVAGGQSQRVRRRRIAAAPWAAEVLETRQLLSAIVVTSLADDLTVDGQVTLREAILAANTNASVDGSAAGSSTGQDEITFQSGLAGTIDLNAALGALSISQSVKITGLGADQTTVDAQLHSRVFDILSTAGDVELDAMTITGGSTTAGGASGGGGGIRSQSTGTLTLSASEVTGNSTSGIAANGGGIFAIGAVTLLSSTITGNSVVGGHTDGGGLYTLSGAISATNSTLSENSTTGDYGDGGAIYSTNGSVTLTNTTVTRNTASGAVSEGGGIKTVRGSITLSNSIVSGNTVAPTSNTADIKFVNYSGSASITARHSLVGSNEGTTLAAAPVGSPDANGNLVGTGASPIDAKLSPIDDNGGPTRTNALLPGSPAINAGDDALAVNPDTTPLTTDQRGPGFDRIVGAHVDMGSYEFATPHTGLTLVVTTADDELDADLSDPDDLSLREALALTNADAGPDTITISPTLSGDVIRLSLGQLVISDSVHIVGLGAANSAISGRHASRVFDITAGAGDVTLEGLTIKRGLTTADFSDGDGGGIRSASPGTLTLIGSEVHNNATTGFYARGGGIFSAAGNVVLVDSAITGNSVSGEHSDGGGLLAEGGDVIAANSTFSGNSTAGTYGDGGAIYATNGDVTLTNCTVTENSASGAVSEGGGIKTVRGSITLRNSIVSGNTVAGNFPDIQFVNYAGSAVMTVSHSLIGVNAGTTLAAAPVGSPDADGNFVGTLEAPIDAMLSPLARHGGQTRNHTPQHGSPVINAGDNSLAVGPDGSPLTTDQRGPGFDRILKGTVDMGAVESKFNH